MPFAYLYNLVRFHDSIKAFWILLVCTAHPTKETQKQKILEMGDGGVHGYLSNRSEATPRVG